MSPFCVVRECPGPRLHRRPKKVVSRGLLWRDSARRSGVTRPFRKPHTPRVGSRRAIDISSILRENVCWPSCCGVRTG